MSVIVKILLVMKVFFGSALQLYVIVEMLWPIISQKIERKWLLKLGPYFLRAALTLFSRNHLGKFISSTLSILVSLAISVPNLVNIIPLVGITSGIIQWFVKVNQMYFLLVFLHLKTMNAMRVSRLSIFLSLKTDFRNSSIVDPTIMLRFASISLLFAQEGR